MIADTAVVTPALAAPLARPWPELAAAACTCVACPELVAARTSVVPGSAPAGADVLVVGEAPGAQEDAAGLPFVGRSGQLLDRLLEEAGLPRSQVAVTNVLKCRPPRNRAPRRSEVARCMPWLTRQIELFDPLLIVTLGASAAAALFGPGARIATLRAYPQRYGDRPVLVTYHPSAALRFGPNGEPLAALRAELAAAATLSADLRSARPREA